MENAQQSASRGRKKQVKNNKKPKASHNKANRKDKPFPKKNKIKTTRKVQRLFFPRPVTDDLVARFAGFNVEENATSNTRVMNSSLSQSKEIVCRITDYFDAPEDATKVFFQWYYNNSQQLITATGSATPVCKLREAWLYALPKFSVDTATSSIGVLSSVPSIMGPDGKHVAANPQLKILAPSANSRWVCVNHYKPDKLFTGGLLPQIGPAGQQCVFAGTCTDPDTMVSLVTPKTVQLKIVIKVAGGLDPFTNFEYALDHTAGSSGLADATVYPTITEQRAAIEILGMSNVV